MTEDNFDKHFRNKLKNYDSGVPGHLWSGIEEATKKRKPKFLWLWFGLFSIILIGSGTLLYSNSTDRAIDNKNSNISAFPIQLDKSEVPQAINSIIEEKSQEIIPKTQIQSTSTVSFLPKNDEIAASKSFEKPYSEETSGEAEPVVFAENRYNQSEVYSNQRTKLKADVLPGLLSLLEESDPKKDFLKVPEGCFDFNEPLLSSLYFEALVAPEFAFKNLSNSADSDIDYYQDARESSEKSWYAFSAGLRAGARYRGGLSLRGGVNYTQINEIFEFEKTGITKITTVQVKDDQGNLIRNEEIIETGTIQKKTHNRYRLLDIPVFLGYEWENKKTSFGVFGGAYFNIWSKQKGDILDLNLQPEVISSSVVNRLDYFKNRIGVSLAASASFGYEFAPNLTWQIEPQIRFNSNSFTNEKSPLEQRYLNVGIFTGIRYYFLCRQRN